MIDIESHRDIEEVSIPAIDLDLPSAINGSPPVDGASPSAIDIDSHPDIDVGSHPDIDDVSILAIDMDLPSAIDIGSRLTLDVGSAALRRPLPGTIAWNGITRLLVDIPGVIDVCIQLGAFVHHR